MRIALMAILAMVEFALADITIGAGAQTQADVRRLGVKSGEDVELRPVYFVANCRSIMIGLPEIEILEPTSGHAQYQGGPSPSAPPRLCCPGGGRQADAECQERHRANGSKADFSAEVQDQGRRPPD